MENKNKIKEILIELGLSTNDSIIPFFPRVRDRNDVSVLKCTKSGVIFLSSTDHIDNSYYTQKDNFDYWGTDDREEALKKLGSEDDQRRYGQFKGIIENKKWLDVGTGVGGILDLLSPTANVTKAVEPQKNVKDFLEESGYDVYLSVENAEDDFFDVVTLFHVFEHFTDPIDTLKVARRKMTKGGKIIIEVPHANDFLISFLESDDFKSFTFWSEHLILHTRESLSAFLKEAGFSNITVSGFQRFPLVNHLHWLSKGKPGGHIDWPRLRTEELDRAYANMLSDIDKTDTLIAIAENL